MQVCTWWQVNNNAVHTKKPDTAWAVVVMRKIGWSAVRSGASGSHEMLGPVGDTVGGDLGTIAATEASPNCSDKGTSRLQSLGLWKGIRKNHFHIQIITLSKKTISKFFYTNSFLYQFRWIHWQIYCSLKSRRLEKGFRITKEHLVPHPHPLYSQSEMRPSGRWLR